LSRPGSLSRANIDRRTRHWLRPGDVTATLAALEAAIEQGTINAIGKVRAAWWLRRELDLAPDYDPAAIADARRLLDRLDLGDLPAVPDVVRLRGWIHDWRERAGIGALTRLAELAGVKCKELSEVRTGKSLTEEKRERIAAAIIASGRQS
jgi:hypothetical protein